MSTSIYSSAKALVDQFDLTPFLKAVKNSRSRSAEDKTTLASGRSKEFIPGLKDGGISAEGFFDAVPAGIDAVLRAALDNTNTKSVTVIKDNAVGSDAELSKTNGTKYE